MMSSGWRRFWRPWRIGNEAEQPKAQHSSHYAHASTDKQGKESVESSSKSADRNELPLCPKEIKTLLGRKLGLEERPKASTDGHFSLEQSSERCAVLREIYMAMRSGERQELDKKFDAFFTLRDDTKMDVSPLLEAIRLERRICEAEILTDSLYLVELLEHRLANNDPGIVGQAAMIRAGDVRAMLAEIFALRRRGVRDLAAHLDTIHRLVPSLCECLHAALIFQPGSARQREEWQEFFLEPDRLDAVDAANEGARANADSHMHSVDYEYQELFSLERALQVDRAMAPSSVIRSMLDWPSSKPHSDVRRHLAYFFGAFRRLPAEEQERALPRLREAVFEELVPEDPELPWSYQKSTADRWFIRILSFGEQPLALLFGEQNAKGVLELAERARDECYEANKHHGTQDEHDARRDQRLKSIEEQLSYLLGSDRFDWKGEFDGEAARGHLLDLMLNVQENTSIYVFHEGSYPICSKYCDLLWDKAVSAILLEQKVTIVESAYEQWRWLELMRKLSVVRLRAHHPQWRLGWRW